MSRELHSSPTREGNSESACVHLRTGFQDGGGVRQTVPRRLKRPEEANHRGLRMCPQKFQLHLGNHGSDGGGVKHKGYIFTVTGSPLADLWVGGKLGATAGSTAKF